jgi:drug/metabolite transporter (DMT)-like permease
MFPSHLGELAALGTAVSWTVTALAFESAGKRVGSLAVNLIRLVLAFALLSLFCWATRGHPLPTDATTHAWGWLAVSGLVGFTAGDLCLFRAFVVIGSRLSTLLMALVPPLTALIGWLALGETLSVREWSGMALTVGGVVWVIRERVPDDSGQHRHPPARGVLLGLGGTAGQAVGLVLSKYGMGAYNAFAATQIRIIAGALGFVALFFLIDWWPRVFAALRHPGAMTRTGIGAVFGPFVGVSLSLVAVQHTEAGVAATIMALGPVLIIPPTIWLYKKRVSARAIAGAVIAIAGTALLFAA